MEELEIRCRRHLQIEHNIEGIAIHLRCGELSVKDLAAIPDVLPILFISDVSDYETDWVIQTTLALRPKTALLNLPYFGILFLPRSKLTVAGVEAIARGFFESGQRFQIMKVSSPYIDNEINDKFGLMIAEKYNISHLTFTNDKEMEFTDIIEDICEDVESWRDSIDDEIADFFSSTTGKYGVPLGSVLCPVWVDIFFTDFSSFNMLVSEQRTIVESLFC